MNILKARFKVFDEKSEKSETTLLLMNLLQSTDMCFLSNNIYDYTNVSQGKITIPNVDDGEECMLADVSQQIDQFSRSTFCSISCKLFDIPTLEEIFRFPLLENIFPKPQKIL